jgi:hypothetical protein
MAWHQGELAEAERMVREATVQWHRGSDRMAAADGIELLGVLAAARERHADAARLLAAAAAARAPLRYLAPGFTANRDAAPVPPARPSTSSATTASPRPGTKARHSLSATRWPTPPARAAAANDPPLAGPA